MKKNPRYKQYRNMKGLTLKEVEAATGVDTGQLSRIERGLQQPGYHKLKLLSKLYGVEIDVLMGEAEAAA